MMAAQPLYILNMVICGMSDLNGEKRGRPTAVLILIGLIIAVGIYWIVQGILILDDVNAILGEIDVAEELEEYFDEITGLISTVVAVIVFIFVAITFTIAFLVYSGRGRGMVTFFAVLTVIITIFDFVYAGTIDVYSLFLLAVSILALVFAYRPESSAYFNSRGRN